MNLRLYTPGPLEYYPLARKAMRTKVHHRTPEFREMVKRIRANLEKMLRAEPPVMLSSSGTGAINAVFQNFVKPQDKILVVSNGKFGERIAKIARFYGFPKLEVVEVMPGQPITADHVKGKRCDFLFMTYVETSTGTLNKVSEIAKAIKEESGAKVVVDAVSAFGAYPIYPKEDGIDVLIWATHKVLGCPPGVAFIWHSLEPKPRDFYFDLAAEKKKQEEQNEFRFTPPVEVVAALDAVLAWVANEHRAFMQMHEERAVKFREWASELGLKVFSRSPARTVTALEVKNAEKVIEALKERGFLIGFGREREGRIVRVSHMGNVKMRELKRIAELIAEAQEHL